MAGEAEDRLGTLDLPGSQLPLLQALMSAAPNTPVVLVLLNGGPLSSPWAYTNAQAVLESWYVVTGSGVFEVGVEGRQRVVLCGRLVVVIGLRERQVPWLLWRAGHRGRAVWGHLTRGSTACDDREWRGPAAAVHRLLPQHGPGTHSLVSSMWCAA